MNYFYNIIVLYQRVQKFICIIKDIEFPTFYTVCKSFVINILFCTHNNLYLIFHIQSFFTRISHYKPSFIMPYRDILLAPLYSREVIRGYQLAKHFA
ncbi:hypothetical protein BDI_0873 [Parabacteroides distasonis ATCC 8503]|uniref:Uncharacterized protein n=1 Tax=Parabacteroides distasonis (strain ATCC 8503 / DSM 20701 / CIP 104284 / JCM 5825 / NCTC 11152) TaxID=435591 RepID=A6LAC8_PARD8|nr:hypothetical protein BDI_0873 [Parabacteroides distasonis ATCC 8503]